MSFYKGWTVPDAIDALMAYDCGATDSGVNDPAMKEALRKHLLEMSDKEFNDICCGIILKYVSEEGRAQGYGISAVSEFMAWMRDLPIAF